MGLGWRWWYRHESCTTALCRLQYTVYTCVMYSVQPHDRQLEQEDSLSCGSDGPLTITLHISYTYIEGYTFLPTSWGHHADTQTRSTVGSRAASRSARDSDSGTLAPLEQSSIASQSAALERYTHASAAASSKQLECREEFHARCVVRWRRCEILSQLVTCLPCLSTREPNNPIVSCLACVSSPLPP